MDLNIRIEREKIEEKTMNQFASLSSKSQGRDREEKQCDIRTDYQRDRDRILHCKSFRRLKHKTQVFIAPEGDHYRTRLTHTLEVSQISRTISRALKLNEDLTEAIALGHDLGHTPFGHAGEIALNDVCPVGFKHNEQSLRIVETIENKGRGLNLTKEVRNGIVNHPSARMPNTLEGKVVRVSDKIAYINHDIDDALRGKIISLEDIPYECLEALGYTSRERINNIIHDIVNNSYDVDDIKMSENIEKAIKKLRTFMFEKVYVGSRAKDQEQKAQNLIKKLYEYFINNIELMPFEYSEMINEKKESIAQVVCDYIAGMTDTYAVKTFKEIYVPRAWDIY